MSRLSAAEVRDYVVRSLDLAPDTPDDFDLLTSGVIDSFGVIELITDVNERFGLDIDFEELDPEGLTVVGPFSRHVAAMSQVPALRSGS
jgi:acyl carrier protein